MVPHLRDGGTAAMEDEHRVTFWKFNEKQRLNWTAEAGPTSAGAEAPPVEKD